MHSHHQQPNIASAIFRVRPAGDLIDHSYLSIVILKNAVPSIKSHSHIPVCVSLRPVYGVSTFFLLFCCRRRSEDVCAAVVFLCPIYFVGEKALFHETPSRHILTACRGSVAHSSRRPLRPPLGFSLCLRCFFSRGGRFILHAQE